jgi:flagellar biosynthesis protein
MGVKVREDADLAELLAKLDIDTPIPSEAIVAVAEILAKVYEANARMAPAAIGS